VTIVHAKKAKRASGSHRARISRRRTPRTGRRAEEWVMEQLEKAKDAYEQVQELQRKQGR
jgi:hypothetical protein